MASGVRGVCLWWGQDAGELIAAMVEAEIMGISFGSVESCIKLPP